MHGWMSALIPLWLLCLPNHVSSLCLGCLSFCPKSEKPSFCLSVGLFEIWHADVSWPPPKLIRLWSWSVDLPNFGAYWNRSNLGLPGIIWKMHGRNGVKFVMLMYPDWPHSELIRLGSWSVSSFWHHFDLMKLVKFTVSGHFLENCSNLGFPGIFWRMHGRNSLKFCMLMYPDHLQNWLDFGHSLLIFLILAPVLT